MPTIFDSDRAQLRNVFANFVMLMLGSLWGAILLSRFFQGLSMQQPEKKGLLSLFNAGMPEDTLRPWSQTAAETLAIWDASNQGLIFLLSDFSRHVKHEGVAIRPWLLCKYIFFGLSMAAISSISTFNGTIDAGADVKNQGVSTATLGVGVTVAALSGLATIYFAYSRGVEINDQAWWPGTLKHRATFLWTAVLSNSAQGILGFYQARQATKYVRAATLLTLLSLVGMNGTQMRVYGRDLARSEQELIPVSAPQAPIPTFGRILCGYLSIANWFNVISAPAMLRSNLSEIEVYKAHQDDLAVLIPTLVIGVCVGAVTVALVNSFRLGAIRELCSKGVPTEFTQRLGALKAKLSLPYCKAGQVSQEVPLLGEDLSHA